MKKQTKLFRRSRRWLEIAARPVRRYWDAASPSGPVKMTVHMQFGDNPPVPYLAPQAAYPPKAREKGKPGPKPAL